MQPHHSSSCVFQLSSTRFSCTLFSSQNHAQLYAESLLRMQSRSTFRFAARCRHLSSLSLRSACDRNTYQQPLSMSSYPWTCLHFIHSGALRWPALRSAHISTPSPSRQRACERSAFAARSSPAHHQGSNLGQSSSLHSISASRHNTSHQHQPARRSVTHAQAIESASDQAALSSDNQLGLDSQVQ